MDRYDRALRDIQRKTEDREIRWKVIPPDLFSPILINSHRILRAFTADYVVGSKKFLLLFVERKSNVLGDLGEFEEGRVFEVLILGEDHQIVLPLSEGIVERDDLLLLAGTIDGTNDRVNELFSAFEESGAA